MEPINYTTSTASVPADRFIALVGVLTRECDLVEKLVFKLTEAELLATAGEIRFMGYMIDEVDDAAGELGAVELARGILVADLARELGFGSDDVPLTELVPYAPTDVADALLRLRDRLSAVTGQLESATRRGRAVAAAQLDEVHAALERTEPLASGGAGYNRWGTATAAASAAGYRINQTM